ncbi:MAG: divergent polysaccharide deacetylase family protein [Clostridia bacterium]|nr:divergent polysaccharide deacetylase family protein [Clostridia bacterium]
MLFFLLLAGGCLLSAWIGLSAGEEADGTAGGRLAIVIDDFGQQRKGVSEMLHLDCKLTAAVIPFLEYTEDDVEDALENGKEVIIHIPMQATTHDNPRHLGPRPVTTGMTREEILSWMKDALDEIPEAVGANIHMGTLCSTKQDVMSPIFEFLQEKQMYFLDSKTSSKSICREVAQTTTVAFYENRVFLEHERKTKDYVKKRLRKAMDIALSEGECIAIGHVGNEGGMITVEAIRELMPEFEENHVSLVFLSELTPFACREAGK